MNSPKTVKFLAQLVHRGLLGAEAAQGALSAPDAKKFLIDQGIVTAEQWDEWVDTNAGTRPKLTRYELLRDLGEGGEARVFEARDRQSGDVVALKVLKSELSKDSTVVQRFIAEAKLLIELECENIVSGNRVAREGPVFFSAMELIDGENLQDRLAEFGPLDEDLALDVVRQVANALSYLHTRNFVHRDIKPGNLLLSKDGRVVLIDLGFAMSGGADTAESETTAGTVHYISPEQARGRDGLDVRADIYSLGATLYHLLTGSLPFAGESSEEVMAKQVLEALSGEEIRAMDLSPQVHYLIEKMMAKEKEIRFQDPSQLAEEVEAVLEQRRREAELRERPSSPLLGRRRSSGGRGDRDRDRGSRRRRRR